MDAISFVVGIKSKQLRSESLKDLVYNGDGKRERAKRKAKVSLIYQPSDSEMDGAEELLRFSRVVNYKGASSYYLQDRVVSWEAYNDQLKEIGVLVKARNFLVFQGDVESIASKTPIERTCYFEEISSSVELKVKYEELRDKKAEAERQQAMNVNEKRTIQRERSQVKEQQKAAELYHKKKALLKELQLDFMLWELFLAKKDIERASKKKSEVEQEMVALCNTEESVVSQLEDQKAENSRVKGLRAKAERKKRKFAAKLKEKEYGVIKAKEAEKHSRKKVEDSKTEIGNLKKAKQKRETEMKSLEKDIQALEKAATKLRAQKEKRDQRSEEHSKRLSKEQLKELEDIRHDINFRTVVEKETLENLRLDRSMKADALTRLGNTLEGLQKQKEDLVATQVTLVDEAGAKEAEIGELTKEAGHLASKAAEAKKEMRRLERRREDLVSEMSKVTETLDEMDIANQENNRERKSFEDVQLLKRRFRGVYGRLVDLIEPKQKQYEVALTTSLGRKNLEAIVCDTLETAQLCGDLLQERQIRGKNFMPLDKIKVKSKHALNRERLRHFSSSNAQSFRLAFDIVDYDKKLVKAVDFALGSTVICETLDDARYLIYKKNEKCKVVTLTGEVISADGSSVTGGRLARGKGNQFEQKEADKTLRKLEELDDELKDIQRRLYRSERYQGGDEVDHYEEKRSALQSRISHGRSTLSLLRERGKKITAELAGIEKRMTELEPEQQRTEKDMSDIDGKLAEVNQKVIEIEGAALEKFATKYGLENVQLSEQKTVQEDNEFLDKLSKVSDQKSKLEGRLNYYKGVDYTKKLAREQTKLEKLQNEASSAKEVSSQKRQDFNALKNSSDELAHQVDQLENQASELQITLNETMKRREEIKGEKKSLVKQTSQIEAKLEKFRGSRHQLLNEAVVKEVNLPTKKGVPLNSLTLAAQLGTQERPTQSDVEESQSNSGSYGLEKESENENLYTYSQTNPLTYGFSQEESKAVKNDNLKTDIIDFESFVSRCKQRKQRDRFSGKDISKAGASATNNERDQIRHSFQTEITNLEGEVSQMEPNLGVKDDLTEVSEKLKSTNESLKSSAEQMRELDAQFEELKAERKDRFMEMFNHVESQIDRIYKELTKSRLHQFGGSASLYLEDQDEPWEGGVRVSVSVCLSVGNVRLCSSPRPHRARNIKR